MIKKYQGTVSAAVLAAMVLVSLFGAVLDLAKRPESHSEASVLVTQPPHYTGPESCLVEGTGQPESCRGGLPECLQEDGSGPGVWCFWTDPDTQGIWFNDGIEDNDPQDVS